MLLEKQSYVSPQFGMPVEVMDDATKVTQVTGETIQLVVASTNVNDAGSAAGTVVYAKTAYSKISDSMGLKVGDKNDSSFAFVTGTILTTEVGFPYAVLESNTGATRAIKLAAIGALLSNGQYCIDYRSGLIVGKKATTGTSDTANYKYRTSVENVVGTVTADTEFAAAAALADGTANPTTTSVASMVHGFNGTTWDRLRSDILKHLIVKPDYPLPKVTHVSPLDGSAAYTSNVSVTCTGFPFTVEDAGCLVAFIAYKPTGGTWKVLTNGVDGVSMVASANVITLTGGGTPFASGDSYVVGLISQDKAYDQASDARRVAEVDPISQHYVSETLAALTNIATNTTGYLYTDWDGYRYGSFQIETSGTTPTDTLTVTFEATCQADGTVPASCTYQDITNALFGAASYVDTNAFLRVTTPLIVKYLRLKYVTSNGGGNDADMTVYHKRSF